MLDVVTSILVPAASYDLVALADLKADLGITDDSRDDFLARALSQASLQAAAYCRRPFVVETVEDRFDSPRHRLRPHHEHLEVLPLSRYPVTAVVVVTEGDLTLVENVDYRLDPASGQLWRLFDGITTVWRYLPVTVQYTAGFTAIPLDLQGAVSRIVSAMLQAQARDPYLKAEMVEGVGSNTYWIPTGADAGRFTPDVAEVLDSYRSSLL